MVEFHISSLVVHCLPERVTAVRALLESTPGAEVAAAAGGKLVITLETASEAEIVESLNRIQLGHGVLAATLVFHHVEEEPACPSPAAK